MLKTIFVNLLTLISLIGYSQSSIISNQQAIVVYTIADDLAFEKLFQEVYSKTILIEFDESFTTIETFELLDIDGKLGQEKIRLDIFNVKKKIAEDLYEIESTYKGGIYEFGINEKESFVVLSSRTYHFFSSIDGGMFSVTQQFNY
ncbi:MAG: hypothetical protein P1U70_15995 [Saprospiraceae bacterium]|jgi:hypothetical protein|nr:hypothetical protein [Saprospiraceae bacterium]